MTDLMINKIYEEARKYNGLIKTKKIEELGIPRRKIRHLLDERILVRESQGVYSVPDSVTDEYAIIQRRTDKLVYSYGTALYFHGLSDRVPHYIDVTVPQGYNVGRLKKSYPRLRFHYVKPELLNMGATEVTTPQGSNIIAYSPDRCICDFIKSEKRVDKQVYIQAIKEFFSSDYKSREILKMAKTIGVELEVRRYMEVL